MAQFRRRNFCPEQDAPMNQARPTLRAMLHKRWQAPLLIASLALLGAGVAKVVRAHERVSFEQHVQRVRVLHAHAAWARASAYLTHLLANAKLPMPERGEFHRLLVATIHQAEARAALHAPSNVQSIIFNFNKATQFGATILADEFVALGDAYAWSNQPEQALDAYRQAIRRMESPSDGLLRKVVELQTPPGGLVPEAALADLGWLLELREASPGHYRWALERQLDLLLDKGRVSEAHELVKEGAKRLAGTEEAVALAYYEALCLRAGGRADEAEAVLRCLRNEWRTRDELWARAGWLLGRLQQADDRPQAAIAFYDEVMSAFPRGDINDACRLGMAESLAMLERYEASLDAFEELRRRLVGARANVMVDVSALSAAMAVIGEQRMASDDFELGVKFLAGALRYLSEGDLEGRTRLMARMAEAQEAQARHADLDHDDPAAAEKRRRLFAGAAESFLELSRLSRENESAAASALERAAECFDAAGDIQRVIVCLERYASEFPAQARRSDVLLKLGQAWRSLRNYEAAISTFDELMRAYPRWQPALAASVPLAECLLNVGPAGEARGEALLLDIVDDRGADSLFRPDSADYRQALFLLAEYYVRASDRAEAQGAAAADIQSTLLKAIPRLEDAIGLYPNDSRRPQLEFLLADAYRRSSALIRADAAAQADASAMREANRRLEQALAGYESVKATLASRDEPSLTPLESASLRAAYLYIGDCLFDMGNFERATEAYREAAWRYENFPAAVTAMMQVVNCQERLGRRDEARAALARLNWLIRKMPDEAFESQPGQSSKRDWQAMAERMERTGLH